MADQPENTAPVEKGDDTSKVEAEVRPLQTITTATDNQSYRAMVETRQQDARDNLPRTLITDNQVSINKFGEQAKRPEGEPGKPTPQEMARAFRELTRDRLEAGKTPAQIKQEFDRVLGNVPPKQNPNGWSVEVGENGQLQLKKAPAEKPVAFINKGDVAGPGEIETKTQAGARHAEKFDSIDPTTPKGQQQLEAYLTKSLPQLLKGMTPQAQEQFLQGLQDRAKEAGHTFTVEPNGTFKFQHRDGGTPVEGDFTENNRPADRVGRSDSEIPKNLNDAQKAAFTSLVNSIENRQFNSPQELSQAVRKVMTDNGMSAIKQNEFVQGLDKAVKESLGPEFSIIRNRNDGSISVRADVGKGEFVNLPREMKFDNARDYVKDITDIRAGTDTNSRNLLGDPTNADSLGNRIARNFESMPADQRDNYLMGINNALRSAGDGRQLTVNAQGKLELKSASATEQTAVYGERTEDSTGVPAEIKDAKARAEYPALSDRLLNSTGENRDQVIRDIDQATRNLPKSERAAFIQALNQQMKDSGVNFKIRDTGTGANAKLEANQVLKIPVMNLSDLSALPDREVTVPKSIEGDPAKVQEFRQMMTDLANGISPSTLENLRGKIDPKASSDYLEHINSFLQQSDSTRNFQFAKGNDGIELRVKTDGAGRERWDKVPPGLTDKQVRDFGNALQSFGARSSETSLQKALTGADGPGAAFARIYDSLPATAREQFLKATNDAIAKTYGSGQYLKATESGGGLELHKGNLIGSTKLDSYSADSGYVIPKFDTGDGTAAVEALRAYAAEIEATQNPDVLSLKINGENVKIDVPPTLRGPENAAQRAVFEQQVKAIADMGPPADPKIALAQLGRDIAKTYGTMEGPKAAEYLAGINQALGRAFKESFLSASGNGTDLDLKYFNRVVGDIGLSTHQATFRPTNENEFRVGDSLISPPEALSTPEARAEFAKQITDLVSTNGDTTAIKDLLSKGKVGPELTRIYNSLPEADKAKFLEQVNKAMTDAGVMLEVTADNTGLNFNSLMGPLDRYTFGELPQNLPDSEAADFRRFNQAIKDGNLSSVGFELANKINSLSEPLRTAYIEKLNEQIRQQLGPDRGIRFNADKLELAKAWDTGYGASVENQFEVGPLGDAINRLKKDFNVDLPVDSDARRDAVKILQSVESLKDASRLSGKEQSDKVAEILKSLSGIKLTDAMRTAIQSNVEGLTLGENSIRLGNTNLQFRNVNGMDFVLPGSLTSTDLATFQRILTNTDLTRNFTGNASRQAQELLSKLPPGERQVLIDAINQSLKLTSITKQQIREVQTADGPRMVVQDGQNRQVLLDDKGRPAPFDQQFKFALSQDNPAAEIQRLASENPTELKAMLAGLVSKAKGTGADAVTAKADLAKLASITGGANPSLIRDSVSSAVKDSDIANSAEFAKEIGLTSPELQTSLAQRDALKALGITDFSKVANPAELIAAVDSLKGLNNETDLAKKNEALQKIFSAFTAAGLSEPDRNRMIANLKAMPGMPENLAFNGTKLVFGQAEAAFKVVESPNIVQAVLDAVISPARAAGPADVVITYAKPQVGEVIKVGNDKAALTDLVIPNIPENLREQLRNDAYSFRATLDVIKADPARAQELLKGLGPHVASILDGIPDANNRRLYIQALNQFLTKAYTSVGLSSQLGRYQFNEAAATGTPPRAQMSSIEGFNYTKANNDQAMQDRRIPETEKRLRDSGLPEPLNSEANIQALAKLADRLGMGAPADRTKLAADIKTKLAELNTPELKEAFLKAINATSAYRAIVDRSGNVQIFQPEREMAEIVRQSITGNEAQRNAAIDKLRALGGDHIYSQTEALLNLAKQDATRDAATTRLAELLAGDSKISNTVRDRLLQMATDAGSRTLVADTIAKLAANNKPELVSTLLTGIARATTGGTEFFNELASQLVRQNKPEAAKAVLDWFKQNNSPAAEAAIRRLVDTMGRTPEGLTALGLKVESGVIKVGNLEIRRDTTGATTDADTIKSELARHGITETNPIEAAKKFQALKNLSDALKSPTGDVASALKVLRASGLLDAQLQNVATNFNKERGANDIQLSSDGKSLVFKVNGKDITVPESLSRESMTQLGDLARKLSTATEATSRALGDQLKTILGTMSPDTRAALTEQLNGLTQKTGIRFELSADFKGLTVIFNDKPVGARMEIAQPAATALDTTQMAARLAELGIKDVPPSKVEQVYRAIDQLKRDLNNPHSNIGESARILKSLGLNAEQLKAASDAVNAGLGDTAIKFSADGKLTLKVGDKPVTLPDTLPRALINKLQTLATELPTATKAQAEKMAQRLKPILDSLGTEARDQLRTQLNNLAPGRPEENKGVRFNITEGKLGVTFDNAVLGKPTDLAQPPKDQPALPGELNLTAKEAQQLELYRKLIDGPPPLTPPASGSFHHALVARAQKMGLTFPPGMLSALAVTLRDNTFAAAGRNDLHSTDAATISNAKMVELLRKYPAPGDVRAGDAPLGTIPPEIKNAAQLKAWLATEAGAATVRDALGSNNPQDRLNLSRNLAALGIKDFTVGDKSFKIETTRNGKVTLSLAGTPDSPIARGTFTRNGFTPDTSVTPGDKLAGVSFKDAKIVIAGTEVQKRSDSVLAATPIRDLTPDQAKTYLQEKYGITEADPTKAKELYTKIETARRDFASGKVESVRALLAALPTTGDAAQRVITDLNSTAGTTPGALRINPETRNLEMRIGTGNAATDYANLGSQPESAVRDLVRIAKTNPELAKFKLDVLNMPNDANRPAAIQALLGQFKNDPVKMNLALTEAIKVLRTPDMSLKTFADTYGEKLLPNGGRFYFHSSTNDLTVNMKGDDKKSMGEFVIGEGNLKTTDNAAPVINRDVLARTLDGLNVSKTQQAEIYNRMDALRNAGDAATRLAAYKALLVSLGNAKVPSEKFNEIATSFNNGNALKFNESTKTLMIPGSPDINLRRVETPRGYLTDFFAPAILSEAQSEQYMQIMRGLKSGKLPENIAKMAEQLKGLSAQDRAHYIAEANLALKKSSGNPYVVTLEGNNFKVTNPGSWWKSDIPKEYALGDAAVASSTRLDATAAPGTTDRTTAVRAGEALFTTPKYNPANHAELTRKLADIVNALPPTERAAALKELSDKLRAKVGDNPALANIAFRVDQDGKRLTLGRDVERVLPGGVKVPEFQTIGQPVTLSDRAVAVTAATPIDRAAMARDLTKYGIPLDANSEKAYLAIRDLKSKLESSAPDVATAFKALRALNLSPAQMTEIAKDINTGRDGKPLRLSPDGSALVIRAAGKDITVPPALNDVQLANLTKLATDMQTAKTDNVQQLRDQFKAIIEQVPLQARKPLADQLNASTTAEGIKFVVNPEGTKLQAMFNKAAVGDAITLGAPPVEQPTAATVTMPELNDAQKAQLALLKKLTAEKPLNPPSGGSFYQAIEQRAKSMGLKLTHEQILPLAQALNRQFAVRGAVKSKDSTQALTGDPSGDARLARVILGEKVPLIGAAPTDAPTARIEYPPANATPDQVKAWLRTDAGTASIRNAFASTPQESLKMARVLAQAGIDKFRAKGPDGQDVEFTIKQEKNGANTRVTLGRINGTADEPLLRGTFGPRGTFALDSIVSAQTFEAWKAFDWKKSPIKMDGADLKPISDAPATTAADRFKAPLDAAAQVLTNNFDRNNPANRQALAAVFNSIPKADRVAFRDLLQSKLDAAGRDIPALLNVEIKVTNNGGTFELGQRTPVYQRLGDAITLTDTPAATRDAAIPTVLSPTEATTKLTELINKPQASHGDSYKGELSKAFADYIRAQIAEKGKGQIDAIYTQAQALFPSGSNYFLNRSGDIITLRSGTPGVSYMDMVKVELAKVPEKDATETPNQMAARLMEPFLQMNPQGKRAQLEIVARELARLNPTEAKNRVDEMQALIAKNLTGTMGPLKLWLNPQNQLEFGRQQTGKAFERSFAPVDIKAPDSTLAPVEKRATELKDMSPEVQTALTAGLALFASYNPANPGNAEQRMMEILRPILTANLRREVLAEIKRKTPALNNVQFLLSTDGQVFRIPPPLSRAA